MTRHTSFTFTVEPTASQREALRKHVGAARFAFNQCLRFVRDALAAKQLGGAVRVPWSGFDLINAFNTWKLTEAAGIDENGKHGLSWRAEVCQQVFEEGAADLGQALAAFSARKGRARPGHAGRFPRFKKKATDRASFRIRNKRAGLQSAAIRFGVGKVRSVRLPTLGELSVRESTRPLRRMIKNGRARILFATVSCSSDGRWRIALNVEADEFHPASRHVDVGSQPIVGIDRGLVTFAVVAGERGHNAERIEAPRPLRTKIRVLRKRSKSLSRKNGGSRNRQHARVALAKTHARIRLVRRSFLHRESSRLAKNHSHLVIEDLNTAGLMKTRLARSVADSGWGLFARMLSYKTAWYGAELTIADRFFPSTRRCNVCHNIERKLELGVRAFHCSRCGYEADRDVNAAANLASYPLIAWGDESTHVAAKHAETQNACGEWSADAGPYARA